MVVILAHLWLGLNSPEGEQLLSQYAAISVLI